MSVHYPPIGNVAVSAGRIDDEAERFRLFIESVDEYALYLLDTEGRIRSWNRGAHRIKGWDSDEIIGRHFSTFYLPEDIAAGVPQHALEWAESTGCYRGEGWRLRKDGTRFWAEVTVTALRDTDGVLCGFSKITKDLTERKQEAERQLAARVERANREARADVQRLSSDHLPITSRAGGYAVALLLPTLLLLLQSRVLPQLRWAPFLLVYAGVLVVTWLAGRRPGWVALAVSVVLEDWFLLEPWHSMRLDASGALALAIFAACSSINILLVDRLRRALATARQLQGRERSRLLALQAAGMGTFEQDPATQELLIDARGRAVFGLSAGAEVTHQQLIGAIHADDRSRVDRIREWSFDPASGGVFEAEYRVVGIEDRMTRWVAACGRVLFDSTGRPLRFLGTVTDISRRKAVEAEAERSRKLHRALFEQAPIGIFTADAGGRYLEINPAGCRLLGLSWDKLRGRSIDELVHSDDRPRLGALREKLLRGEVDISEWHMQHASGEYLPVEATTWMLGDGRWQTFVRDIGERRRADERARSEAEFRERVVGIVGHDLRNPLAAVLMSARTLARGQLGERETQAAQRIVRAGDRMHHLISDLLDYSQTRASGGLPVTPGPGDAGEVCRAVVDEVRAASPERELHLDTAGDLSAVFDAARVAQALGNLISNALTHGAPGVPVEVRAEGRVSELHLSVHNMGDPIPPELLPHLFEPFRRGGAGNRGSAGLGLYIAERVMRAHGGHIEVDSRPGKGTRFTLRLPRWPEQRADHPDLENSPEPRESSSLH